MERILVCVKAVPASACVPVDGQHRMDREGAGLQWNLADESALEAAFRLRRGEGTVSVLTMGPAKLEGPMRELLARGADQAILVTDPQMAGADTHATAAALRAAVERLGPFQLILCGRRTMDGETGQVPGELAAALGVPCLSDVEQVGWEGERLLLHRRLEEGVQVIRAVPPLVLGVCEYAYPLRLAGILGLRQAREKQVKRLNGAELGLMPEECGLEGSLTQVISLTRKFPGLRRGPKERKLERGIDQLREYLLEADR